MTHWTDLANCIGVPASTMFPPPGRAGERIAAEAKAICAECVVRDACLEHALEHNERHGIWGGTDAAERRWMRRGQRRAEPAHGTRARYTAGCRCDYYRARRRA